ncbi:MAG: hypothetical protein QOJ07_3089 [Thermoleophilaceae bacterium]|nr:hypothetical protein [Thermoleophilaceae bacterium]
MVQVREFTDPACPFAFSAEPALLRLRWLYGDSLDWQTHMIVLSESTDDYAARGFGTKQLAAGLRKLQERYGMPIDWSERPRMHATADACRAVVAARLQSPAAAQELLRALRVRTMAGALLDERSTIEAAAEDVGIDSGDLLRRMREPEVEQALRADMTASRSPSPASLALGHKLASSGDGKRYTCPSLEIEGPEGRFDAPGFQPVEVYEAAVANVAPATARRAAPESVEEVLDWAGHPLATVEVAAVMELEPDEARAELARVALLDPVGPDGYWSLRRMPASLAA